MPRAVEPSRSGPLQAFNAVQSFRSQSPSVMEAWDTDDEGEPLSTLFRDGARGGYAFGLACHRARYKFSKTLRESGSGAAVMTAEGGGFPSFLERQRKRWTVYDDRKRIAMHVQLSRICWLKKERQGAGPAVYELRAYEPHHSHPAIIAAPEDGRLVFRSWAGRKQQGDALCEVTFDSSLLGPGAPLPAASEEDAAGGWRARCHVAIAPRAELPLLLMLLSIYRHLIDEDEAAAALAADKAAAAADKAVQKQQARQQRREGSSAAQPAGVLAVPVAEVAAAPPADGPGSAAAAEAAAVEEAAAAAVRTAAAEAAPAE